AGPVRALVLEGDAPLLPGSGPGGAGGVGGGGATGAAAGPRQRPGPALAGVAPPVPVPGRRRPGPPRPGGPGRGASPRPGVRALGPEGRRVRRPQGRGDGARTVRPVLRLRLPAA